MMNTILNEKKIRLHAMIKATLERIDSILQKKKFLKPREKKVGSSPSDDYQSIKRYKDRGKHSGTVKEQHQKPR